MSDIGFSEFDFNALFLSRHLIGVSACRAFFSPTNLIIVQNQNSKMYKTKSFFATAVIAALALIIGISSCKKNHGNNHDMLNIDYPAAYIVNGSSNNISVIKLSDNTVTETIDLNGATYPHHIYLNPAKTKLAVAITSTDLSGGHGGHGGTPTGLKVQIIDAVTGMIDKEVALNKMPHNAIFNPSGTELWMGQSDSAQSQVLVYKTSDWTLQNTINVGAGLSEVTFSSDGSMAFACNTDDGTVSLIDAKNKTMHATLTVGQAPVGAWKASNGKMYVDNETSQTISEITVSSMSVTATINLGFKPGYAAYNSSNGELWVSDATNGRIAYYTFDGSTWNFQNNITTGADAHAIAFIADGSKAYVTNQGANTVSVIDVATHAVTKTITAGTKPNGIAIKQ
jgi:YVTN family beta-propeller protein